MRRNQSPHSPLTWSVTILLTWATFVSVSDSKTISCSISSVEEHHQATLTCDAGEEYTDDSWNHISVKHYFPKGPSELILDCHRQDMLSSHTCVEKKADLHTDNVKPLGRYMEVEFTAEKDREGWYLCNTSEPGITSRPCYFTIRERIRCQVPPVGKDQQATLTCDYGKEMCAGDCKEITVDHRVGNKTPEEILKCYRMDMLSDYECSGTSGFIANTKNMGQYLTVKFKAEEDKEGWYRCKPERGGTDECEFTIYEEPHIEALHDYQDYIVLAAPSLGIVGMFIMGAFLFISCRNRHSRYKPVVLSNAIESLISIVCSMKIMHEKLEPERADDVQQLVTRAGTGFKAEMSADLAHIMARLWRDPKLQDFVRREAENLHQDSGVYFLNSLDRITAPNYKPTKKDVDKAWVKLAGARKTSFTFQAFHQRFLREQTSTAEGAASDLARETDHLLSGDQEDTVRLSSRPLEVTWTRGHKQDVEKGQQEGV